MTSNPPRKHHFTPVFHLDEWTGADGELEQFHRPWGPQIKVRRLPPTATGFKTDLYAMPGLPAHLTQQAETLFMQEVDSLAAVELARMKAGDLPSTSAQRSAWTRYMLSLQLRTPADIAGVKARARNDWGTEIPKVRETYESIKRLGEPATFEEFITGDDPDMVERVGMKLATVLIDNPKTGALINNMRWSVLDLSPSNLELVFSDRGIEQSLGLGDTRAIITVPISPKKLFIAAHDAVRIENLRTHPPRDIVRARNLTSVSLARTYVWASDRSQEAFIKARFATVSAPTLGERLAETAA
ncbi:MULTISPECIES: DUF4238 domain-containing protein [unclassified Brevundimonas]|uniref:DUF4238 domain-containing protein n=1 Tax=unclassified Brevundimonas TaxID=2622653 RepID=UPI000CFD78CD|nr:MULTISPECIES: DUF4238 domain-containing protein [unclassified Brevundimonas]PRA27166.1 hypothetical protein CQ024_11720 [Brevundimonas sp. MYb27]PQZ77373.1 hypothetical protein CQ026_13225 [Brevundimonas sp. MYb31]PRB17583.1 hypothetical protein CQ039_00650 [Brevundimonas sp. MYb52]PRB37955.1 hypothetical protein CQ035_00650 [Brevundimonas sp. MYb46]PRB46304.1 hypothetical protein CQ028_11815 [Brevundimonas sp. MYb33]